MENENNYSIEIIRYNISMDNQNEFIEAYDNASKILKNSPFCAGLEVIHGVDEPENFIVRIHWTSLEDHLNKFRQSAEFQSFFALVKPF